VRATQRASSEAMEHKIIFTGPVGAGKTTAIGTVSDIPVVGTEAAATDSVRNLKAKTTVAMDYGILNIGEGRKVHLYGTPGQERFSFMWDILAEGAMGLVLLANNAASNPLAELDFYVNSFKRFLARSGNALVVGVSRLESAPEPRLDAYRVRLRAMNLNVPVLEVDPRRREDVKQLLLALLALLDPTVRRRAS